MNVAHAFATWLILLPTYAHAFDADGFQSGMTVKASYQHMLATGLRPETRRSGIIGEGVVYVHAKSSDDSYAVNLTFCNGVLTGYEKQPRNSFGGFVRRLQIELARRGQPSVRSNDFGENTYQISASWDKPITDNFSITYVESPTISIARISFEDVPMRDKCKIN